MFQLGIPMGVLLTYQLNPTAWNWGGYTGFFWAGSGFLVSVWVFFRLPECKGRTFRELGECCMLRATLTSRYSLRAKGIGAQVLLNRRGCRRGVVDVFLQMVSSSYPLSSCCQRAVALYFRGSENIRVSQCS
jgi:hypothetical protein